MLDGIKELPKEFKDFCIINNRGEVEVTDEEYDGEYNEWLEETYGSLEIGGATYEASQILLEVDPIAYRVLFSEFLDYKREEVEERIQEQQSQE